MVQIITRQEAMAQGLSHYFTGKPCVRGHIAKRHTKRKVCEDCDQYHNKAITERLKAQGKYYHGKPCKHGHTLKFSSGRTCVECNANRLTAEERREYKQKYYAENYDKISTYNKRYEAENRELVNERHRKWHASRSPELKAKHAEYARQYRQEHRAEHAARNSIRRKQIHLATPSWANHEAILDIYKERQRRSESEGILYHVDHEVPLVSDVVCGLHVEANLRVITAEENQRKNNKWEM